MRFPGLCNTLKQRPFVVMRLYSAMQKYYDVPDCLVEKQKCLHLVQIIIESLILS